MRSNSKFHLNGSAGRTSYPLSSDFTEDTLKGTDLNLGNMNKPGKGSPNGSGNLLFGSEDKEFRGEPAHRPLSTFRIVRGILCLVVLLSTAFTLLVFLGPFAALLLRLLSIHMSRQVVSFLFGKWLALWPFLFEKVNKTKVIFSGDKVPEMERVLIISNHRTEVDWMYLWDLALRKGCIGHLKYILKSSLMKLPVFGWGFHIFEFISVERKWDVDEPVMRQMLSTLVDPRDNLWLVVFPEGTDFTSQRTNVFAFTIPGRRKL